jgi:uncharacterized membrane protein
MADLVVIGFEDEHKAEEVRLALLRMQREYLIDLEDAVVAIKKENGKIKLNQAVNLTAAGAVSGGFWGTLVGLLFMSPLLGAAVGAAAGAVSGSLSDIGIDDNFMKELSEQLQPGHSALFILVRKVTPDRVLQELRGMGGTVLRTSLSHEKQTALQEALSAAREQVQEQQQQSQGEQQQQSQGDQQQQSQGDQQEQAEA